MAGESVAGGRSIAITRLSSWRGTPDGVPAPPRGFGAPAKLLDVLTFFATLLLPV